MQLLKKHGENFFSPATAVQAAVADQSDWPVDPFAESADAETADAPAQPEPAGDVMPCAACTAGHEGCRNFVWLDRYGGHHCPDCAFPPSLGMVGRIVFVGPERPGGERMMVDMTKKLLPILEAEFFRRVAAKRQAALDAAAVEEADIPF